MHNGISNFIAFLAGLLSFFSPCILPLVPSYITYITGISFKELTLSEKRLGLRWITFLHSFLFILGFSSIFILMGASASYLGQIIAEYQSLIMKVGGILIIVLGIHFIGIINIPFLQTEKRFELKEKPLSYFGSFLVGVIFSAGWTPCIGPILSSILIYTSTAQSLKKGIWLLFLYSSGLGIPFLLTSLAFNTFIYTFGKIKKFMRYITILSGLLLIFIGILLLTGVFRGLSYYLTIF
jgi:cytochrome c-type biogenesis protein